jgi:capsular polysaccharide biosynthesis protein
VSFGNRPIIGVPQQTHYHWLIESLPRIIKAARYERDAILIAPTGLGGVQRSALEILGNEIVYTDNRCTSNNLILATHSDDSGWAHPSDLELLRKTYQVPTESGSQYLFVTRVNSRRSDAMSKTIENFARRTGWTIVRAEELSWSEHLDLFGHAKAIAGEHGAGLANLALAPKYCNLQELLRRDCANPCYAALSVSLNGNGLCYRLIGLDRYEELLMS